MRYLNLSSYQLIRAIVLGLVLTPTALMAQTPTPTPTATPTAVPTWWQKLLRVTGISATPAKQRGSAQSIESGRIWIADLREKSRRRLTSESGYRSPIFVDKDKNILMLRNDEVVRIPVSGGPVITLFKIKGAIKLVGQSLDDIDKVLMLVQDENGKTNIALLSLSSGKLTVVPYETNSPEGKSMFDHFAGWNRTYGTTEVSVSEKVKKDESGRILTRWTDVFLKRIDQEPINVSNCNGINCGQPSLSQNGQLLAFVKAS